MNLPPSDTIKAMVDFYEGGAQVKDVAITFGFSTGKAYYILRDAGCKFRPRWTGPHSEETKNRISAAHKWKTVSDESRRKMSESKKCHYNGFNGIGHLKQHASGYVLAYVPDHPHATADGYVFLHTVVMERAIGRYLNSDEVVHHINRQKNDNRLENLALMNRHEHQSMHMRDRYAKRRNGLINRVILIGNLANDPEGRTTQSGISNSTFRLAVQRRFANAQGVREADFLTIVAWRQTADFCNRYLTKGRRVAVEGSIQTRSYDAQDGSKRYVTEIIADSIEALGGGEERREKPAQTPGNDFVEVEDDNLPWER